VIRMVHARTVNAFVAPECAWAAQVGTEASRC
jgi:hypothetical protein